MHRAQRTGIATLTFLAAAALAHAGPPPATDALQIRFGLFLPKGGGDLWDTNEDVFTSDVSDLDDFVLGLSWVHGFTNYVEFGVNLDFYDGTDSSQYREFVDEDGFAILHDTELTLMPLTVDVRFLPFGRHRIRAHGRRVPKPVFYVGGGIGTVFWNYEEVGGFLDFTDAPPIIFPGQFDDEGAAFEIHALAGIEVPLGPRTNLLFEGRYSMADDELRDSFDGLGTIELGGRAFYGGFSFRF